MLLPDRMMQPSRYYPAEPKGFSVEFRRQISSSAIMYLDHEGNSMIWASDLPFGPLLVQLGSYFKQLLFSYDTNKRTDICASLVMLANLFKVGSRKFRGRDLALLK